MPPQLGRHSSFQVDCGRSHAAFAKGFFLVPMVFQRFLLDFLFLGGAFFLGVLVVFQWFPLGILWFVWLRISGN